MNFCRIMLSFSLLTLGTLGCAGRPELLPNSDKTLRKTSAEFAADAAKRFPFKSDAPKGGDAPGRAQVGYTLNKVEIVNTSPEPWNDVEVWINESYVVFVPQMQPGKLKSLPFQMIYNDAGRSFPLDNSKVLVDKVDLYMNGKMYTVPKQQAD